MNTQAQGGFKSSMQKVFGKLRPKKKEGKEGKSREIIALISKGLMLPIAMLPIAGLFLGIGAAIATAGANAGNSSLVIFGNFLKLPGDVIFGALPVLFAVAITIAFTKDAGPAALSSLVGFLVFSGIQASLISPVKDGAGQVIGYDLLFYTQGALGPVISDKAGLPTFLFGSTLGIFQLSSSVFGGFLVGFTVAFLYNKYKDIQLPTAIGFFSGVRFIPIVTFFALFPITIVFMMLWPLIGVMFYYIGSAMGDNMYGFNSFIFGFIERSLVPFGLHHAFYSPLWYAQAGGILNTEGLAIVDGGLVTLNGAAGGAVSWAQVIEKLGVYPDGVKPSYEGDQTIFAFLNSVVGLKVDVIKDGELVQRTIQFSDFTGRVYKDWYNDLGGESLGFAVAANGINVGQYMMGKYPFMMFGLPAAGAAMVMAAPKENRKMSASIVLSAALTCFLTGITEPIEFTFLFLAPWLFWGVHAFFCALSFGLMNWIGLIIPSVAPHIGMTFSGGAIDWVVYGAIQIPGGSNAWWSLIFGLAYVPIYYFLFYFLIKKFDIATPGRGDNTKLFTKKDYLAKKDGKGSEEQAIAVNIINAYGGIENIKTVDACITKLRIVTNDGKKVDKDRLTSELGAMGVIYPSPNTVYSIYGVKAEMYKNQINEIIKEVHDNPAKKDELFKEDKHVKVEGATDVNKSTEKVVVYAPVDCEVVPMENVPDKTFSDGIIGEGVAIKPTAKTFFSPIKGGKMELVFDTGHAYTFTTKGGTSILMHIGIDSIGLKDKDGKELKPFKPAVKTGDKVTGTSKIVDVNTANLKEYAKSEITPIVVMNETLGGRTINVLAKGKVKKGEPLFEIK